jgi:hypothetical protein
LAGSYTTINPDGWCNSVQSQFQIEWNGTVQ